LTIESIQRNLLQITFATVFTENFKLNFLAS